MFSAPFAVLWSVAALAQEPVAAGSVFSVKEVSPADGYYPQKASLIGKECTASGQLTVTPGTTWYGGPAVCSGSTYYFYQVAIDKKAMFGSATASAMLAGTTFVVKDIASDDAYSTTRSTIVGIACTAGNGMTRTDGAWWAGPARCGEKDYYFYKVAFDITGAAPVTAGLASATLNALPTGSVFVVRDVHTDDAYVSEKVTLVGASCVAGSDMYRTEGQWWAGSATCNNKSYYFYKMAFDVTTVAAGDPSSAWGSATTPDSLYPPTQIVVRDIGTDDIYASQRALLVGQTCSVAAELHRNDGAWYGGDVNCANGAYYYFYKVAFDVAGAVNALPSSGFGSATAPDTLSPPTQFVVREIAADDAYFPSASTLVGQTCTVNGDLHRQDGQWYGGAANCGPDANYYYFYKMAFDLVGGAVIGGFGSASAPEALGQGTSLIVRDIASDDAYASSAGSIVGRTCTVGASGLTRTTGAYFGGDVNCSDGTYYYFYKMAFDLAEAGPTSAGTVISVLDVASDDAYYGDRAQIIGQTCTVVSGLTPADTGSDWYGGDVNCANGSYYYFYKMKYALGGGSTRTDGRYTGTSVPKKSLVTIIDVGPDDTFYAYRESLLTLTCQVKAGDLVSTGDAWFGGTLKCNGSKLHFYQVAVQYQ